MKRIGVALLVAIGIAVANLGWTWLQRRAGDLRMERAIQARRNRGGGSIQTVSSTRVRITQFYATSAEITDADHNTICYGVENAKAVRLEPPVESLTPALARCIWVEPRQDTTYKLIAEGLDGSEDSASFQVHVKPAPPSIVFMAVSTKEIVPGDAVTVCYGVSHATSVRLQPIGWALAPVARNCVRFYPPASMKFTLVASGAGGMKDTDHFQVKVVPPSPGPPSRNRP